MGRTKSFSCIQTSGLVGFRKIFATAARSLSFLSQSMRSVILAPLPLRRQAALIPRSLSRHSLGEDGRLACSGRLRSPLRSLTWGQHNSETDEAAPGVREGIIINTALVGRASWSLRTWLENLTLMKLLSSGNQNLLSRPTRGSGLARCCH